MRNDADTIFSSINFRILCKIVLKRMDASKEKSENYEHCKTSNPSLCPTVKINTKFRKDTD